MSSKKDLPLQDLSLLKSNSFITSKMTASLLERKVMDLALSRIEVNASDKDYPLKARLYPGELSKLVSDKHHIYRDMSKLADSLIGHTLFIEDGKGNFKAFSVVPNCNYVDGILEVIFNPELKDHVLMLEKDFTKLEQSVLLGFDKVASYRLYELLKKETYRIPAGKNAFCKVRYNICELKFMMGLANMENEKVKNILRNKKQNVEWDELYKLLDKSERKYEKYADFKRYVLEPAQEEFLCCSDIRFEFEGEKTVRAYTHIVFTIYHNSPAARAEIDERAEFLEQREQDNRQLEMPMDMFPKLYEDYVGHNKLTKEDITTLLKKANMDEQKVRKYIKMADRQSEIRNYMGWIVDAIENEYDDVAVVEGDAELGSVMREIRENIEENKDKLAEDMWSRTKRKDDYAKFIEELSARNISEEQLEVLYAVTDRITLYTDWLFKRGLFE